MGPEVQGREVLGRGTVRYRKTHRRRGCVQETSKWIIAVKPTVELTAEDTCNMGSDDAVTASRETGTHPEGQPDKLLEKPEDDNLQ